MPHAHPTGTLVQLPAKMRLALDIARHLSESVLVPGAIFYTVTVVLGLFSAILAALVWAMLAVVVRLARRERPPVLLLAATGITLVRVAITYLADSATAYFLQPTLATYLFAAVLMLSLSSDRPLIQRLANDFLPLPDHVVSSAPVRRLFRRLSVLWGAVLVVNASATLGLLLTMSTTWSVPLATAASAPAFALGLMLSLAWFRRSLHDGGFRLAWGREA